jgi:hypothetical protein
MYSPPNIYENCFVTLMKIFNIYQTYLPLLWKKLFEYVYIEKNQCFVQLFNINCAIVKKIEGLFEIQFLVDTVTSWVL